MGVFNYTISQQSHCLANRFVQHIDTVATVVTNRMVQNKGDMWEPLLVYYLVRSCDLVTGVDCGIS